MTKRELIDLLSAYPDSMEVKVTCDRRVRAVLKVGDIVDMNTNVVSVEITAEDKPGFSAMARDITARMYLSSVAVERGPDDVPKEVETTEQT